MEDDSVKLLRECNAGIKMGISSIDDVMDHVQNDGLRGVLKDSHDIHCRLATTLPTVWKLWQKHIGWMRWCW